MAKRFLLIVLLISACSATKARSAIATATTVESTTTTTEVTHNINGTLELVNGVYGKNCFGARGFSDIASGAQIVMKNSSNSVIAEASLSNGEAGNYVVRNYGTEFAGETPVTLGDYTSCSFSFEFVGVPEVNFYQLSIGNRGGPTYSLQDMQQANWTIGLKLGAK